MSNGNIPKIFVNEHLDKLLKDIRRSGIITKEDVEKVLS